MPPPLALIAAVARHRVLGRAGRMPWHHPADLAHFRSITCGHCLIIGRVTWEAIGRPLPDRILVVLSRQRLVPPDPRVLVAGTWELALELAAGRDPAPFVAGGESLYRLALPLASRLVLTEIDEEHPGDRFFPWFDPAGWQEAGRRQEGVLCFRDLLRR